MAAFSQTQFVAIIITFREQEMVILIFVFPSYDLQG